MQSHNFLIWGFSFQFREHIFYAHIKYVPFVFFLHLRGIGVLDRLHYAHNSETTNENELFKIITEKFIYNRNFRDQRVWIFTLNLEIVCMLNVDCTSGWFFSFPLLIMFSPRDFRLPLILIENNYKRFINRCTSFVHPAATIMTKWMGLVWFQQFRSRLMCLTKHQKYQTLLIAIVTSTIISNEYCEIKYTNIISFVHCYLYKLNFII